MSIRTSARKLFSRLNAFFHAVAERGGGTRKVAIRVGAALSLVFIVLLVHRTAYSLITKSPDFKVPQQTARASVAPPWADPNAGESVVLLPAGRESLLDPDLVPSVAASFESNPWVRRVVSVERAFPDRIR